jgi:hypothetical protein
LCSSTEQGTAADTQVKSAALGSERLIFEQAVETTTRRLGHDFSPSEEAKMTAKYRDREQYFHAGKRTTKGERQSEAAPAGSRHLSNRDMMQLYDPDIQKSKKTPGACGSIGQRETKGGTA